jgi:hypothetical protein
VSVRETGRGLQAQAHVQISPTPVARLELEPRRVELQPGQVQQFQVRLLDKHGRVTQGRLQWQAQGGEIDAQGKYQAGPKPG